MKELEVDFIGKIVAAVSHEFMNVLATIRESSGLLEDLLALNDKDFPHRDKFVRNLAITRKHVSRGMELGEYLNAFAHNLDQPKMEPEINALMSQIAFLMDRFARLKRVQLNVQPAEKPLAIAADPFLLQLLMAKCIEACLKYTAGGGAVTIQCRKEGRRVLLTCQGEPFAHAGEGANVLDGEAASLSEILRRLGAGLSSFTKAGSGGFEIVLPHPQAG